MSAKMSSRDRFLATMRYEPVDRAPYRSWGAWPETIERWKTEGYDPDISFKNYCIFMEKLRAIL